ncbi:Methanogenesis regulatory histidine kinase FilI [uncultured archaeon]|nr:Methanogenesis regulatory histidine kinase FilI [uncultured archaeon]
MDRTYVANYLPMRDERGKTISVMAVIQDVSEVKKAEAILMTYAETLETEVKKRTKELNDEKIRVEALSEVKDEFIKNITHELKTPLSVILGNLALLKDYAPARKETEWAKLLSMLERNSVRLRNSIEQILQLSRLETADLRTEKIHLQDELKDVCEEYLPLAKMGGIELNLKTNPVVVDGDVGLIRLAISNIVGNAIKFTRKGSVNIVLSEKDGKAMISVADTGMGISQKNMKKLFTKFFKADENAPGAGIGLAITKEIISKHGGTIRARSEVGKGSTFTVTLSNRVKAKKKTRK